MSKHIDYTAFTIVNAEEFGDGVMLAIVRAADGTQCEMCMKRAEYVVSAAELGPGGYDVPYCQTCAAGAREFARDTGDVWVPQN